ncbi:MAG: DUF3800 domain-containing protein [Aquirufa sp.]
MELMYLDESGDDGHGEGASRFFVLTSVRIQADDWAHWEKRIGNFRAELEAAINLPSHRELHTRAILLRKGPFAALQTDILDITQLTKAIGRLAEEGRITIRTVVVDKRGEAQPLKAALLAQMIHRAGLRLAISDRGRVPRMRQLIRIAEASGKLPNPPIERLLEIESKDSALVQLADFFATAGYLRACFEAGIPVHARINRDEAMALIKETEGANRTYCLIRPEGTA